MKSLVCSVNRDHVVAADAKPGDPCATDGCDGVLEEAKGTDATIVESPPPPADAVVPPQVDVEPEPPQVDIMSLLEPPKEPEPPKDKPEPPKPVEPEPPKPAEPEPPLDKPEPPKPAEPEPPQDKPESPKPAEPEPPLEPVVELPDDDSSIPGPDTMEAMEDVGVTRRRHGRRNAALAMTAVAAVLLIVAIATLGGKKEAAPTKGSDTTAAPAATKATTPATTTTAAARFAAECTYVDDGTRTSVVCQSTDVKDSFTIRINWLPANEQPAPPHAYAVLSTTIGGRTFTSATVRMVEGMTGSLGQVAFATK